jgi:tetratricopeptide (TPR) repeat protein
MFVRSISRCTGLAALLLTLAALGRAQAPAWKAPAPVFQELPTEAPAWLESYRVRWPLRIVADPAKQKAETVIVSLPTGGWLKPDASDLAIQNARGEVLPIQVLSHDPAGDTIVQFKRSGADAWYWAYGISTGPLPQTKIDPAPKEGLTVEVRDWAGDDLASWMKVRDGLKKSDNVIGNAVVAEVMQNGNPVKPDQMTKFAASYRGFLDIKKDGVYRFFVNADDAAFLFIDGFKVFERPGANDRLIVVKQKLLQEKCGKIELKAGVHPFEVHHVVGNNTRSAGFCTLLWQPEDQKTFGFVPRTAYAQPMIAMPAAVEEAKGAPLASFVHGIDDSLSSGVVKLYLVRFEAQGNLKDGDKLTWDFGDGTTGTGRSVLHAYLKDGDYTVTLRSADGLPAFRRTVNVWAAPVQSSPLSLGRAVKSLAESDWKKWEPERIRQMFAFLQVCEQPERWPLIDAVTQHLLTQPDLDREERTRLLITRMDALAHLRRAKEALKLGEQVEKDVAKVPTLLLSVRLAVAGIHQYHLKESAVASKMYKTMLDDYRRIEHPNLRVAAIRWGDLFAEAGELARAGEAYQLANKLGGERFAKAANVNAINRGARLRTAEKKLRDGDVHQTRQLLEQIELDFPEQKLEGLYRFLRAEADRFGGHYEEAIRNYEVLVRLPQWASYRSPAWAGIADSYYRVGQLDRSLEWYDRIKQADADYYGKAKLADRQRLVAARRDRIREAEAKGEKGGLFFEGFASGFEPGEPQPWPELTNLTLARGLGMQGPHVGRCDSLPPSQAGFRYLRPVRNLNPDGWYWVEVWHRETLAGYNQGNQQQAFAWISPEGDKALHIPKGPPTYLDRTYGQWRKLGFKFKAPAAQDGLLVVWFINYLATSEIDGLVIRPISDRQNDSLTSFLEGTETP